ncbi:MAG: hypothetical protein AABZ77_03125 [Chloroflexota bacterium]
MLALTLSQSKGEVRRIAMVRQVPISYGMATMSLTHHERLGIVKTSSQIDGNDHNVYNL